MTRTAVAATAIAFVAALSFTAPALASGGPGGGGGGGGSTTCTPLTLTAHFGQIRDSREYTVNATATIKNCSSSAERLALNVSVPGSQMNPFTYSTALPAGASFTRNASPQGSTPLQLHYGQSYNVIGTLTETSTTPGKVLGTSSMPFTVPSGPAATI